jgi:hypothetical protein
MSRKTLWTSLIASLVLFALVSFGPGVQKARASAGCYDIGDEGTLCAVVQVCDLGGCFWYTYRDGPPCRPAGSGPSCIGEE